MIKGESIIEKSITRGSSNFDILEPYKNVKKILLVSQSSNPGTLKLYENLIDYIQYTHNKIKWSGIDSPADGSSYQIIYTVDNNTNMQYSLDNCPLCAGNGWYASIIDEVTGKLEGVTGVDKLTQDIMKFVLTSKNNSNYGTILPAMLRENIQNDSLVKEEVISAISSMEQQYKEFQTTAILNGAIISDTELLDYISVPDVEVDREQSSILVTMHIYSVATEDTEVVLKV